MLQAISKLFHKKERSRSSKSSDVGLDSSLSRKPYTCRVLLLDESELALDIKLTSKGYVLLDRIFAHLNLNEREYFGLRYLDEFKQPLWLDISKAIIAQLQGEPPYSLYFSVKFYAVDPCKLSDEVTRYQFFLQVKQDISQGRLPIPFEVAVQLAAYAVQSELGDLDPRRHPPGYVSQFTFVPNQTQEFEFKVENLHQTLRGQLPSRAEYHYLDKVKWMDMYGVDLHPVVGDGNIEYFLGLTPSGIVVYKNKTKVTNYFWPRVSKVTYKSKFFLIRARDKNNVENTFTFECSSKSTCKHLYKCCVEYHSFFRLTSASHSFQQSMGRLLSFGSKYRYSGRYGKSSSSSSVRSEDVVIRRPTTRQFRRMSGSESCPEDFTSMPRPTSSVVLQEPANKLYTTTGRESPTSVHSEYFPRRCVSGSESDNTICPRANTGSGSESDVSSCRHGHRHRHRARLVENMNVTESQWIDAESRIRDGHLAGSLTSMVSAPEQRRQRKRSKSPGNRPPDELAQHFRYIDPNEEGMTEDQLKDIPYTRVETALGATVKLRYSPRTRHKIRQYRRQKSCGEVPNSSLLRLPDGEAPPPYPDPNTSYQSSHNKVHLVQPLALNHPPLHHRPHHHQRHDFEFMKSPMAVQIMETQNAPIVKTKVLTRCVEASSSNAFNNHSKVFETQMRLNEHQPRSDNPVNHVREDSGLDLDSPGGSSNSHMVDQFQQQLHHHHQQQLQQQLHQQQQLRSPPASYNSQRRRSPTPGTPAPASGTSPFIEQASSENHMSNAYRGRQDHNDLDVLTSGPGLYTPGVSYYCEYGENGATARRRQITDL